MWIISWVNYRRGGNDEQVMDVTSTKSEYKNIDIRDKSVFRVNYFTIIFIYLGLIGYLTSASVWKKSEEEKIKKSFGYYMNLDEDIANSNKKRILHYLDITPQDDDEGESNGD